MKKKDVDNEVLFSYLMAASLYHHIIYNYINGTHYESRQPIFCGQYPSLWVARHKILVVEKI
jgi:hypothetical protein